MARSALIVANAAYDDPALRRLRAPAHDADHLADVLRDPEIGGFEVDLLSDADERAVRRRLAAFFAERDRNDLLLVHFSCHGLKDQRGRLHLAARDTELRSLGATAVPGAFVNDLMAESASRRIVLVLDCCYSGAFARGAVVRADRSMHLAEEFGGGSGRIVLTASSATEYAFEGDDLSEADGRPSVFTSALVQGLATGEADLNGDGEISVDELYDYAYRQVRDHTPYQAPQKWSFGIQGDVIVARSTRPMPEAPVVAAAQAADPGHAAPAEAGGATAHPPDRAGVAAAGRLGGAAGVLALLAVAVYTVGLYPGDEWSYSRGNYAGMGLRLTAESAGNTLPFAALVVPATLLFWPSPAAQRWGAALLAGAGAWFVQRLSTLFNEQDVKSNSDLVHPGWLLEVGAAVIALLGVGCAVALLRRLPDTTWCRRPRHVGVAVSVAAAGVLASTLAARQPVIVSTSALEGVVALVAAATLFLGALARPHHLGVMVVAGWVAGGLLRLVGWAWLAAAGLASDEARSLVPTLGGLAATLAAVGAGIAWLDRTGDDADTRPAGGPRPTS